MIISLFMTASRYEKGSTHCSFRPSNPYAVILNRFHDQNPIIMLHFYYYLNLEDYINMFCYCTVLPLKSYQLAFEPHTCRCTVQRLRIHREKI